MFKNADFFNALSNSHELVNKADKALRDHALDDLLKADPTNPKAFRNAISSHKAFWDTYNADLMTVPMESGRLRSAKKLVRNYYNTDRFLKVLPPEEPYSFKKLHQLAAEQRVKIGLKTVDEDVLIGILVNNPDECRAYLASKPQLGSLTQVHGWKPNEAAAVVPPKNTSINVLTDQAIAGIKKEAGELLFFKLIEQSDSLYYLTSLAHAEDKAGLERAAVGIGFPVQGTAFLTLEELEEVRDVIEDRLKRLKRETTHAELTNRNPHIAYRAIERMHDDIQAIEDHLYPLTANRDTFELLNQVQPIHLFNPAFQAKAKSKALAMKEKYQDLSKDCDWLVAELKRVKLILEHYLNSLPLKDYPDFEEAEAVIIRLRKKITDELEEIKHNLIIYEAGQNKLIAILQAIDDAAIGKKNYYYNGKGIKRGTCRIGDLPVIPGSEEDVVSAEASLSPPATIPAPVVPKPTSVVIAPSGPLGFVLEDTPAEGWMNYFDITHHTPHGVESFGRFTEQHNGPAIVTYENGQITKIPSGRFEIVQFPKAVDPAKARTNLTEAKMNFSMVMAAEILVNLDKPPTSENPIKLAGEDAEELAYLWTALVVLGEKTPHMKFSSDALEVNSSVFSPEQEKGQYWGYASTSLHETVFKNIGLQAVVNPPKEALEAVMNQKCESEDEVKIVTVTSTMRNRLMGVRDNANYIKENSLLLNESSLTLGK